MLTIRELDEQELLQKLENPGTPLAILAVSPFCGTCQVALRMLDIAGHLLPEEVELIRADVNRMPAFVQSLRISSVPALLAVRQDRSVAEPVLYAVQSVEHILDYIRRGTAT
ncbi:thioredoxin family protein [Paenibacillus spiritus]|uniref:Thioredoxin family protein n=1 Tax=Paenibacillus spiritus TaxID=2496557 RepID=A0A5J5GE55_9BACL|nr:thioredoxin family protein [Paenibacillus spiritus]KAA9006516.1 thioredoxin family protein [Paenibacillus spiritus]